MNNIPNRFSVIWLGESDPKFNIEELERRGLNLLIVNRSKILKVLPNVFGVLYKYNPDRTGECIRDLEKYVKPAYDHNIKFVVMAPTESDRIKIQWLLNRRGFKRIPEILGGNKDYEVAEKLRRHSPGPEPRTGLKINYDPLVKPKERKLLNENSFLLKRAFHDCESIIISSLLGGKSSAQVFKVHASIFGSIVGPRPLPFFLKIDKFSETNIEKENYTQYANRYVPFNLRPNLDDQRCVSGYENGLIVGDFVEGADLLIDLIRRGQGHHQISSLFNNTLHGWLQQSRKHTGNLGDAIPNFDLEKILTNPDVIEMVDSGKTSIQPKELLNILKRMPIIEYKIGPIHKDLHGKNVMIRGSDSILIDFAKVCNGPINADRAALEVNAILNANFKGKKEKNWFELVNKIYNLPFLLAGPPVSIDIEGEAEPLWRNVRVIRVIANGDSLTEEEYPILVAQYLLRESKYPGENKKDKIRSQHTYLLAEKLIQDIFRLMKKKRKKTYERKKRKSK